ncbi:MAG: hypothetical protein AAF797_04585 [Planctomycetota bacterium]
MADASTARDAVPADSEAPAETPQDTAISDEVTDVLLLMLPWAITVLIWSAIIVIALFVTFLVLNVEEEEERSTPKVSLSPVPSIELNTDTETETPEEAASASNPTPVPVPQPTPTPSVTPAVNLNALIGVTGAAAAPSPAGTSIATGGAGVSMFGSSSVQAVRIVFLIDASGSLIDTFPFVIRELRRSIDRLVPEQRFTVIFFYGDKQRGEITPVLTEIEPRGLGSSARATDDHKNRVRQWLDPSKHNIEPGYRGDPVAAIKLALSYKPEVIFLLSDNITGAGRWEVQRDQLLAEIKRTNRSGTQINTIQFQYEDPLKKAGISDKRTLQLVSEQNGDGDHVFIQSEQIGIQ